jgi:hypothetical protein
LRESLFGSSVEAQYLLIHNLVIISVIVIVTGLLIVLNLSGAAFMLVGIASRIFCAISIELTSGTLENPQRVRVSKVVSSMRAGGSTA